MESSSALLIGDLAGVAVFAASGGSAAVAQRPDLFGPIFVGFVAAPIFHTWGFAAVGFTRLGQRTALTMLACGGAGCSPRGLACPGR